jgi:hypothetical protein
MKTVIFLLFIIHIFHYGFNELSFIQVMFELFNNTRADATSRVKTPSGAHELTHDCYCRSYY